MPDTREQLRQDFRKRWPIASLDQLTLDTFTGNSEVQPERDWLCYWVERKLKDLGAIGGQRGAVRIGGIHRFATPPKKAPDRLNDDKYVWLRQYGDTADEAFGRIKDGVIAVAKAASKNQFDSVEAIRLPELFKWKLAFLYQGSEDIIIPVYLHRALLWMYRQKVKPEALDGTTREVIYRGLAEHVPAASVFDRYDILWTAWNAHEAELLTRYFALDLRVQGFSPEKIQDICGANHVDADDLLAHVAKLLTDHSVKNGDRIALMVDGEVRARGVIDSEEGEPPSWNQKPNQPFAPDLLALPSHDVRELTTKAERDAIWGVDLEVPPEPGPIIKPFPVIDSFYHPHRTNEPFRATNLILYGPPGTGKTWRLTEEALKICGEWDEKETPAQRQARFRRLQAVGRIAFVTFHQSYGYEDFVEGIRPRPQDDRISYHCESGIFKQMSLRAASEGMAPITSSNGPIALAQEALGHHDLAERFAFDSKMPQFVILIDEINRGNISKIFGELITLVEPSKRMRQEDEQVVKLAVSGQPFAVPPNLHIIGTMNTADRSLALLDIALRRRFKFEEMQPLVEAVAVDAPPDVQKLARDLFTLINDRIEFLYDRDHRIGHAMWMRVKSLDDIKRVIRFDVVPLLQEYFFDAWDKICMVLGCAEGLKDDGKGTQVNKSPIIAAEAFSKTKVLGFEHPMHESRYRYTLNPAFLTATGDDLTPFLRGILDTRKPAAPAAVATAGSGG